MEPIDVKDNTYAGYNENFNKKYSEFKTGDNVRIFLLLKLKIQFFELMLLVTWILKKLLEVFMKKNYKKLVKKNLE